MGRRITQHEISADDLNIKGAGLAEQKGDSMMINVSFSGSGQLYPLFVGALLCLQDRGIKVAEISATSGGAIIAAGYGSGYKPGPSLVELIKRTLPLKNNLFDLSLFSFFTKWGLIKGERIEKVFSDKFCKTLGETKIPVHIVAANVSRRRYRIFSSKKDPNFSVASAVRASISLPLIFAPLEIGGDLYVDGGIVKNLPIDVFTNGLPTIGFRIRSSGGIGQKIKSLKDYLFSLIDTIVDCNEDEDIDDSNSKMVIDLNTKYHSLNFNISEPDVDAMIQEGYKSTAAWLDKNMQKVKSK